MGSPLLNIGITLAIFRLSGYSPLLITRLNKYSRAGIKMDFDNFMNRVEISSEPVELLSIFQIIYL